MKSLFGIICLFASVGGVAQEAETWGNARPLTVEQSLIESLIFSKTDSSADDEDSAADSKAESEQNESISLSRKLIEEVENPASIDSIEKRLYIEEELLDGEMGKNNKRSGETEKETKKSENEFILGPNSIEDILGAPEPDNEKLFSNEEKGLLSVDADSYLMDDELVDDSLL